MNGTIHYYSTFTLSEAETANETETDKIQYPKASEPQKHSHLHTILYKPFLLPPANEVWGKVIFSQASVCPQGGLPDRDPLVDRDPLDRDPP